MASSRPIERGVACPGCPHRAAYVICKEALGRGRGRVICGDAGCAAVGPMHPAACACVGGQSSLLDRYKTPVPLGDTAQASASEACVHFIPDTVLAGKDAASELGDIKAEGRVVILAVLASSRAFLTREAVEDLGARALGLGCDDAVVVDPFDSQRAMDVLGGALARPGAHAVVFASPCAQLQHGEYEAEPAEIESTPA